MKILAWLKHVTPATKADIERILMKVADLQAALDTVNAQLAKATTEITTEIANLQAALTNVDIPQAATDSITKLQGLAQALDDLNPDPAPAPTPTPPPAP